MAGTLQHLRRRGVESGGARLSGDGAVRPALHAAGAGQRGALLAELALAVAAHCQCVSFTAAQQYKPKPHSVTGVFVHDVGTSCLNDRTKCANRWSTAARPANARTWRSGNDRGTDHGQRRVVRGRRQQLGRGDLAAEARVGRESKRQHRLALPAGSTRKPTHMQRHVANT